MTNTNNEMKQYFTEREALEMVLETIKNGYDDHVADLHYGTFNTDYYIIGTYEAKQALEQYGVFEAINKVLEYEKFNFGEVYTDLSQPEQVANALMYIVGEEALQGIESIDKYWNSLMDEAVCSEIKQEIEKAISEL